MRMMVNQKVMQPATVLIFIKKPPKEVDDQARTQHVGHSF